MLYKYVISNQTNPYRNLAIEHELMGYVTAGMAILYLWQNDNSIVIGRNQNVLCECKLDEFLENGGSVARRHSGGGAVYHDLGNLNYSIISTSEDYEECRYQEIVRKALTEFDLFAEYNGRNDLIVSGRKISGNAVYTDGNVTCQHGTILVSSDIEKMTYYLTPEKSKLERNHVSSIASRVVNLQILNKEITVEKMKQSLIQAVAADELSCLMENKKIEELTKFYGSKAWIYGGAR